MKIALVALPVPLAHGFSYIVPEHLAARVVPGVRCICPFRSRTLVGVVLSVLEGEPAKGTRALREVRDDNEVLFQRAQATPMGAQLRVLSGLYLSQMRQGKREASSQSLASLLDYGLKQDQLAMNFVFQPGATALDPSSVRPFSLFCLF